jgi:Fe-S cluster biogenesis protein NfuA
VTVDAEGPGSLNCAILPQVTRRERIDEVIRDVLRPLVEKDGGGIEVVRFEGSVLTLRLTGTLHGCPGTAYVKRGVIEPAIHTAAGKDVEIVYERPSFAP